MNAAHTSFRHIGIAGRACGAAASVVLVLMMTGGKCPASTTTTPAPSPTSLPAAFRKGLPEVHGSDTTDMMWQMLAAIVVISILGVLAFIVVKRLLPKIGRVSGKRISVVETVYLQPKKALHLIEVGSRKFLISSSPEGLSCVGDVTDAFGSDYAEIASRVEDGAKEPEKGNGKRQNGTK